MKLYWRLSEEEKRAKRKAEREKVILSFLGIFHLAIAFWLFCVLMWAVFTPQQ
jgi:hypothetical protein